MLPAAADHGSAAVTATNDKRRFQHRWINNDALRLINQILGNVIRNIHDFLDHRRAVLQAFGFFFVFCAERQPQKSQDEKHGQWLFHFVSPCAPVKPARCSECKSHTNVSWRPTSAPSHAESLARAASKR